MYARGDTEKKTMAYSALECAIWMRNFCRKGILNEFDRREINKRHKEHPSEQEIRDRILKLVSENNNKDERVNEK